MEGGRLLASLYDLEAAGHRRASTEQLRAHLASVVADGVQDIERQRSQSEVLLQEAVSLRAEKRRLEEEIEQWQDDLAQSSSEARRRQDAWILPSRELQMELDAEMASLREAKAQVKRVDARWVVAEDPDWLLDEAHSKLQEARQENEEWTTAHSAADDLRGPMQKRVRELEGVVATLRKSLQVESQQSMDKRDFMLLRQNVTVLGARVAAVSADCDDEVKQLRPRIVEELPRLRQAEKERSHLHRELIKASLDKDRMERDYEGVVVGLAEQEAARMAALQSTRESLMATESEEASLLGSLKAADAECAELRRDRLETEIFVRHLSDEIARLEDQRDELRSSIERAPGGSSALAPLLGSMDQAQCRNWLQEDRSRLLAEWQAAEQHDEAEVRAMTRECQEYHDALLMVEASNMELRRRRQGLPPGAMPPMVAATVVGPDRRGDGIPDIMQSQGQFGVSDYGIPKRM